MNRIFFVQYKFSRTKNYLNNNNNVYDLKLCILLCSY